MEKLIESFYRAARYPSVSLSLSPLPSLPLSLSLFSSLFFFLSFLGFALSHAKYHRSRGHAGTRSGRPGGRNGMENIATPPTSYPPPETLSLLDGISKGERAKKRQSFIRLSIPTFKPRFITNPGWSSSSISGRSR